MKNAMTAIGSIIDGLGVLVGVSDIENWLNVILLCLSVASILWRVGYTIYTKIKQKKLDEIDDVLEEGAKDIENLAKKEEEKKDD